MRKSNSIEFKKSVWAHIIERLSEEETTDLKKQLQNVVTAFDDWYCAYERRRLPNSCDAFEYWLQGLPCELNAEFTYYAQRCALKNWFDQAQAQADKYEDDEVSKIYYRIIYREFCNLCRQNSVKLKSLA